MRTCAYTLYAYMSEAIVFNSCFKPTRSRAYLQLVVHSERCLPLCLSPHPSFISSPDAIARLDRSAMPKRISNHYLIAHVVFHPICT